MNKTIFFAVVIILIAITVGYSVFFNGYRAASNIQHSFVVSESYEQVWKKILREDVTQDIAELNYGKVVSTEWVSADLAFDKAYSPFRTGTLKLERLFTVEMTHEHLGQQCLDYHQEISISNAAMTIRTRMVGSICSVKGQETVIFIYPNGNGTQIDIQSSLMVEKCIPRAYYEYMQSKINEANAKSVANIETCIRKASVQPKYSIPLKISKEQNTPRRLNYR